MIYSSFNAYSIEFRKIENSKNVTLMSHLKIKSLKKENRDPYSFRKRLRDSILLIKKKGLMMITSPLILSPHIG